MKEAKKGTKYEVKVTSAIRKKIDDAVRAAADKHAIAAALDKRYTGKVGSYGPYERYITDHNHTIFVSLDTFKAKMSEKADMYAAGKVEKREKRAAKAQEKKVKQVATVAAKSYGKKTPNLMATLETPGVSSSSRKHNQRKGRTVKPEATVNA